MHYNVKLCLSGTYILYKLFKTNEWLKAGLDNQPMCSVLCQFAIQWKRYQDLLHLYKLNPGAYTKEVDDLTSFLAQVSAVHNFLPH